MDADVKAVCERCSAGSEDGSLNFPQQLGMLSAVGVEGYYADLRRATKTYYLSSGESIEVAAARVKTPVAAIFDAGAVESAVRLSQANAHTYPEFCEKIAAAGCPAYVVSILGRRVVYLGRTAEAHVEHFPKGP